MPLYRIYHRGIIWGSTEVEASSPEEAIAMVDNTPESFEDDNVSWEVFSYESEDGEEHNITIEGRMEDIYCNIRRRLNKAGLHLEIEDFLKLLEKHLTFIVDKIIEEEA